MAAHGEEASEQQQHPHRGHHHAPEEPERAAQHAKPATPEEEALVEFVLQGARELVDEARAKALVEESLSSLGEQGHTLCRRIKLSNKSLSEEAARVVAGALRTMEQVEHADISDIIAGRHELEALQVLEIVCEGLSGRQLRSIDLSDNALGEKGINACRAILEGQDQLASIYVNNNGLSAAAAHAVVEILTFRTPTNLRVLHFFNNMSGDGGAEALASLMEHAPLLEDLRFSGTRAGPKGSLVFAQAVHAEAEKGALVGLVKIDLADNSFGGAAGELLAAALRRQPRLEELNLRDCSLEDDGAAAIVEALATACPLLRRLDLSGNEITPSGMPAIAKALPKLPALEALLLEENEIGNAGAKRLARALGRCAKLTALKLNQNEIRRTGALAVVAAFVSRPGVEEAALQASHLELNTNELSEAGVKEVEALLEGRGLLSILGEMDENEGEDDDEEEEEEEEDEDEEDEEAAGEAAEGLDDLIAGVAGVKV